ncbi:MAG: hypothetical protein K0U98_07380 [Deltaproteobacteria bacterium]|nr:hypothetical protein [Deltaproteobacteria bacterium]
MASKNEIGSEDQRYFLAIEEAFIRLRGAPLLLSPADWRQARAWREEGIPLGLVLEALEDLFERRRERGTKGSISSLRYCQRAIQEAWESARELNLTAQRQAAPSLDVPAALQALANSLPEALPQRESFVAAILAAGQEPEKSEQELEALDEQLLALLETELSPADRQRFEKEMETTLGKLSLRLPEEQVEKARERLRKQKLRSLLGVPVLSLFSVEEPG